MEAPDFPEAYVASAYPLPHGAFLLEDATPIGREMIDFFRLTSNPGYVCTEIACAGNATEQDFPVAEKFYVALLGWEPDNRTAFSSAALLFANDADADYAADWWSTCTYYSRNLRDGRILLTFVMWTAEPTPDVRAALDKMAAQVRDATGAKDLCGNIPE